MDPKQLIMADPKLSIPAPACAPSSPGCGLTKTGTTGSPPHDLFSVVAGSTIRVSYRFDPLFMSTLISADPSFQPAIYSSRGDIADSMTYLDDVEAGGTGFVDILVSSSQTVSVSAFIVSQGPLVVRTLRIVNVSCGVSVNRITYVHEMHEITRLLLFLL